MTRQTWVRGIALVALCAVAPAWAQDVDWASLPYTLHKDLQSVDANGNGVFPLIDPIKVRGVLINFGGDVLNTAPGSDPFLGGQWQQHVQAVDQAGFPADFGGTALFMMQNVGNINPTSASYTAAAWRAELTRLEHDPATGHLLQPGDLVEVRARAPGLFFRGKTNINEAHSSDPAADFDVVLLQPKFGLPEPAVIALSDVKNASNAFIFDPTRATGDEHYQSTAVRFNNVSFVSAANWGPGAQLEIQDGTGRTFPVLLGLGSGFRHFGPPPGTFDIVGILDQEDANEADGLKAGYRLWVPDYTGSEFVLVRYARPDFDKDADVDASDYQHFTDCVTGPAIPQVDSNCRDADFDGDGDVDQSDFGVFQRCISGADQRADPGCSDLP